MQYPSLKKWRFLAVSVAALFVIYTLLDIIVSSNTPCYLMNSGDWLPSAEDPSFAPAERSIFFHETSCAGTLRPRQACAVEAAARAHPQRQVYVLFTAPVTYYTLRTSCLAHLTRLTNVRFARVHVAQYSEGTPAQTILLEALKQSSFPTEHSSDILRIVTLRKWGGIYLDTDMIVTRSLENLPHTFLAKENADNIATGILSIGKDFIGSNLTDIIMKWDSWFLSSSRSTCRFYMKCTCFSVSTFIFDRYMRKYFNPEKWSAIGGSLVDYVIEDMCPKLSYSYDYYENPISYCKGMSPQQVSF